MDICTNPSYVEKQAGLIDSEGTSDYLHVFAHVYGGGRSGNRKDLRVEADFKGFPGQNAVKNTPILPIYVLGSPWCSE